MHTKLQDALTYVHQFGAADFFITFTSNPLWAEIRTTIQDQYPGHQAHEHPEIVSEVFSLKLKALMTLIRRGVLGRTRATVYSVEWQKRGLPHAHILVWMVPEDKPRPDDVDEYISAEIPDAQEDPVLHRIVTRTMVHGPCGDMNPASSCMRDGICSKAFPKTFQLQTEAPHLNTHTHDTEGGAQPTEVRYLIFGEGQPVWVIMVVETTLVLLTQTTLDMVMAVAATVGMVTVAAILKESHFLTTDGSYPITPTSPESWKHMLMWK